MTDGWRRDASSSQPGITGHGTRTEMQTTKLQWPATWMGQFYRPSSRVRLQFARRSIRQPACVCVFQLKLSLHNPRVAANELIKITISWLISCKKLSSKGSQSRSFWIILIECITGSGYENTRLADQRKVQVRTSYQKVAGVDNGVSSVCQGNSLAGRISVILLKEPNDLDTEISNSD